MQFISRAWVLALALAAVGANAQQDFSKVEIKAVPVAGGVHMLEGSGGNIGVLVGPDGVLIVDSQFAPLAPKIEAVLKRLSPGGLHYLVNTHWHGDHTGGNEFFGKQAPIVAHENVRKRLAAKTGPAVAREGLPQIVHDHGLTLHFNDEEIRVVALGPGIPMETASSISPRPMSCTRAISFSTAGSRLSISAAAAMSPGS